MRPLLALLALLSLTVLAPLAAAQRARIGLGPAGAGIDASTTTAGALVVRNGSLVDRIDRVRLDLSTALFPDLVFDPNGGAGDLAGLNLTAHGGAAQVGLGAHTFSGTNGLGFDALSIDFSDFDPGEMFSFSVDVDPTSIQGVAAPGPANSGHVSGLELAGATVEVVFESGLTLVSRAFPASGSVSESFAYVEAGLPPAPTVELLGVNPPAEVTTPEWVVRVTGTPGAAVTLLEVEAGLFTAGVPGGGHELEPFEANCALAVTQHAATLDAAGQAHVPVTLERSLPEGGAMHFMAVEHLDATRRGPSSDPLVLQLAEPPVSFQKLTLVGATLALPTSLQFGPDGRLYVADQHGLIRAMTILRTGDTFDVVDEELIDVVLDIPNHDDDGAPNPGVMTRLVTGLLVTGTAQAPILYVSSSDPRVGAGATGQDVGLDTNSGVVSRIVKSFGLWQRQDLVRGLPRSEEQHGPGGLALDEATHTLYLAQGGHTNMGAPSTNFAFTPEYALSAAILSIDLDAIGGGTHDLATLDDEDRAGVNDAHDPFGGNNGKNQARLVPGGPVQVFSSGWRNPYDVVLTSAGRLYAVDNGPNAGWGDVPVDGGGGCGNTPSEPGQHYSDGLHLVTRGYYAGHPNPTRASVRNTFNATNPQSPVVTSNPIECEYRVPGVDDGALVTFPASTNGICEYTSSAFGGALQGDLLLVSLNRKLRRVKLAADGVTLLKSEVLANAVGVDSLDVTAQGAGDVFPGTIWVTNRLSPSIVVFVPDDQSSCTGVYSRTLDEDEDGYTNADEIDNLTNPCSAADVPPDADGDLVSDLNDPDDDDDSLPDTSDPFAVDAANGFGLAPPFAFTWEADSGDQGGLLGLGLTGVMTNGVDDYLDLFEPENMIVGGAAGVLTVAAVGAGTADGAANDLAYGLQVGFVPPAGHERFAVRTRLVGPFLGQTPGADQALGLALGTGGQDDFVSVRVTGTGVVFTREFGGVQHAPLAHALPFPGPSVVDLWLTVDPVRATVVAGYALDGGALVPLSAPVALPVGWLSGAQALAAGLFATAGTGDTFAATWDFIAVDVVPDAVRVDAGGPAVQGWLDDDPYVSGSSGEFTTNTPVALHGSLPPGTPSQLFRSERHTNGGDVAWAFPLAAQRTYDVRLYFAEIYWSAPGQRVFDVRVEGAVVLDDYDIVSELGPDVGGQRTFRVALTDDELEVRLTPLVDNAKLSAIELLEVVPRRRALSFSGPTVVPGIGLVEDEDVVLYDPASDTWEFLFDGSDVGLADNDVDALHVRADGALILSLARPASISGLTGGPAGAAVEDEDLLLFTFTTSGFETSGTFAFLFDGSDVGLDGDGGDVDGVHEFADGSLALSIHGQALVSGFTLEREDVARFVGTLGAATSGVFAMHFDGSDVGLGDLAVAEVPAAPQGAPGAGRGGENVDALAFEAGTLLHFSTAGPFRAAGAAGDDEDVARFSGVYGSATSGAIELALDLSAAGLDASANVNALAITD
jgi:hypothetical protein